MSSTEDRESCPCPLGCGPAGTVVLTGRDRLHGLPGEFDVVRCAQCGLMRTDPRPTTEAMAAYYPEDYGPYVVSRVGTGSVQSRLRSSVVVRILKRVVRFNTNLLPDMVPGRLLEVGCASGAFLAQMESAGWQVSGIEYSPQASATARAAGFNVFSGAVETAPDPLQPYDLIVGWMVVEHLHDPLGALAKLARWTRPGGGLAISLPDAGALGFRLFKASDYNLQVPTHLYHFTPRTIRMLLEKSGWEIDRIVYHRVLNSLMGSIGNKLEDWRAPKCLVQIFSLYPQRAGRWALILYPLAYLLAAMRQTGRITVLAHKQES